MAREIWKYPVQPTPWTQEIPSSAKFLSVQVQHDDPMMWWLVDPDAPKDILRFVVIGTGIRVTDKVDKFEFLGTFQMYGGQLIWHLFKEPK